ncbi:MAG: arsenate reductase [Pararhodobacter sp.]|nr:arsenate reductase [Pararhodobacter sp.]
MTIYGLPTCDTCRKARKALPAARFRDIRAEPLSEGDIKAFLAQFGERLVNRASTTWRSLSEAERQTMPEALLSAHPALMKRPVILAGGVLYLGWAPDVRRALGVN